MTTASIQRSNRREHSSREKQQKCSSPHTTLGQPLPLSTLSWLSQCPLTSPHEVLGCSCRLSCKSWVSVIPFSWSQISQICGYNWLKPTLTGRQRKRKGQSLNSTIQLPGDSLLNLTYCWVIFLAAASSPHPILFFISWQKVWTSREGDKCFKLWDSTGEHELSRHAFILAVERLFVTIKMGIKAKTEWILRKILVSWWSGL